MFKEISTNWIEKVKDSSDIVNVISSYLPLKQKGRTFWGNCPFHHENEPSFAVNSSEQFFHCFGCGVGGNVITFIEKIESLSFIDAVKLLAEKNNIDLPESIDDIKIKQKMKDKSEFLNINLIAARYYNSKLMSPEGENALNYLYKRGLNKNIVTRFGIGYSLNFNDLLDHLKRNKIPWESAVKAGILGLKNNKYYDFFSERVVFPIINTKDEVVGFSARAIKENYMGGKYKNSPDSIIFNKSEIVYGINLLKKASRLRNVEYAIIVEGQMDVIALHQAGFDTAIACMGTALTVKHAREIHRFVNKVIVCFDGDAAGIKATKRSLDILESAGLEVFVVSLPDKMDPDEYIKKYSKEKFQQLLDNAKSKNDYTFYEITSRYDLKDNRQKAKYIEEMLNMIKNLKTNSEKEIYLNLLKEKTQISMAVLKQDLQEDVKISKIYENTPKQINSAYEKALDFIFASLLNRKSYATLEKMNIVNNEFYSSIYEYIKDFEYFDDTIFEDIKEKIGSEKIDELRNYDFGKIGNEEKYYRDCLKIVRLEELNFQKKMCSENLLNALDDISRAKILEKMQKILIEIQKLKMED